MKRKTSAILLGLTLLSVLFATACPERTSIAEIERNPSRFQNKTVSIAGRVTDSYGVNVPGTPIRGGAYKVDDGTGSIWIVTEDAVPGRGSEIGVKGVIGSGVNWRGRNYGLGMYEKDRRFRSR